MPGRLEGSYTGGERREGAGVKAVTAHSSQMVGTAKCPPAGDWRQNVVSPDSGTALRHKE